MSPPLPLVLHLQGDALNREVPVSDLLRRAKVVATKLDAKDALTWINHELDGYIGIPAKDLPPYRVLNSQPRYFNAYHGWRPLLSEDAEMTEMLTIAFVFQSAGSLEAIVKDKKNETLSLPYPNSLKALIFKQLDFVVDAVQKISPSSIWMIVDHVRNLVLNWTLELEMAGVRGEGLSFTLTEKERAGGVTHNYFAQNIGVAGDVGGEARVHNQQVAAAGELDLGRLRDLVAQLQQAGPALPADAREALQPTIRDLDAELQRPVPDKGKLRQLLSSVRTTCEGAAGNLVASGAVEAIKAIVGG